VRDAFPLRERDQAVGRAVGLHSDDGGAQILRQLDIPGQGLPVSRLDSVGRFTRCFDVDRVPARAEPPGNARAGAKHARRVGIGAHRHHDPLRYERGLQSLALTVGRGLVAHFISDGAERQLTQS